MVYFGKIRLVEYYPCHRFIHPWSESCTKASLIMLWSSIKGSFKLFVAVYGVKALMRKGMDSENGGGTLLKALLRSTVYGALTGTGFVVYNCVLRKILGKFTYKTLGVIPGVLTGMCILIEHPSQRGLMASSFIQMAFTLKLKETNQFRHDRVIRKKATHLFMRCNALIMMIMASHPKTTSKHWIMKAATPELPSPQLRSLVISILKEGAKFAAFGYALNIVRVVIDRLSMRKPCRRIIPAIRRKRNLAPAIFMASYVISFRVLNHLLAGYFGVDRRLAAFISGYFAGASSWFVQPNLPLVGSAMASIVMMVGDIMRTKSTRFVFRYFYEIMYIICCGIVFQARALKPEICPKLVKDVMSTATSKRSDVMAAALNECITEMETRLKFTFNRLY
ncbi:transmembrane protein 135-like [Ischnura elegans]|uniref:transmembrane protein 135-like n=1 Tax=Ischnura elegans TaxID=197161 RepID=UPI001ED8BE26|nr:transmembrane protein 135-like [Ischnura elegans]